MSGYQTKDNIQHLICEKSLYTIWWRCSLLFTYMQFHQAWFDSLMIVYENMSYYVNKKNYIKTRINIFIFQSLMMESLDQLSSNNLEVLDVERGSINSSVMNIDRNKIEAIPKTNQVLTNTCKN